MFYIRMERAVPKKESKTSTDKKFIDILENKSKKQVVKENWG
jgi:hypothetical protein